jgi:MFS family permease
MNEGGGLFSGQRAGLTVGLLMAVTIVAFEALAVSTVMPSAEKDLGHLELYGWAFSGLYLASVIGITWAGQVADRHGPGRPLTVGLVLFGIGLLIAGLAPSMYVLVVGRVVQGLGGGAVPAVIYVIIGRAYPESVRPRMMAMLASAWVIPGFIGPAIGGAVAEWVSWRATFLMIVPLLPLASLLTLPGLYRLGPPEVVEQRSTRLPAAGALALGAGLALAGVATGDFVIGAALVLPGAALAIWALRQLLPPGTFRAERGVPAAIAANGFINAAFFGAEAFIPYLLTTYRGYSTFVAGLALTSATISWTSGSWIQARLAERTSRAARAGAGALLVAIGVGATAIVLDRSVPGAAVALTWGISGLGMGLAYPTFSLEMLAGTASGREGETSSAMKLTETLSSAVASGAAGGLVAAGETAGWPGLALGGVFALAGLAAVTTMTLSTRISHAVGQTVEGVEGALAPELATERV